jgi:hypothetical protein
MIPKTPSLTGRYEKPVRQQGAWPFSYGVSFFKKRMAQVAITGLKGNFRRIRYGIINQRQAISRNRYETFLLPSWKLDLL